MLILGSCLALNLSYSGCCILSLSPTCSNNGCYCDQNCYILNDCCNDIADISCYPTSYSTIASTPTDTLGKRSSTFITYQYVCQKILYLTMYIPTK